MNLSPRHFINLLILLVLLLDSIPIQAGDRDVPICVIGQEVLDAFPTDISKPAVAIQATGAIEGLRSPDMEWVNTTLSGMTLRDKIGQMIIQWYYADSSVSEVTNLKIGGIIFSRRGAASVVDAVNELQVVAQTPLWFAADFEAGTGTRITEGTVFPMNMALGAADSEILAASCGIVTAREAQAMGIQIGFGPVVDVNTDPNNPIIGIRSYSDNPALVTRMARAWVSGAHQGGMLTCLKHYPGHGPTEDDSHTTLPVVRLSEEILRRVHLAPYENLIADGYSDLVMSAHVWYTELDPGDPMPATLSHKAMTQILRQEMGFTGLTISDAFTMAGLGNVFPVDQAVVIGVQNGLDIILMPPNTAQAINALETAVNEGVIPLSRIEDAVRRILMAKSQVGLPENRFRNEAAMWATLARPEHHAVAQAVARASITRVSEAQGVLPLLPEQKVLCLIVEHQRSGLYYRHYSNFTNRLAADLPLMEVRSVALNITQTGINQILADATGFDRVILATYDWIKITQSNQLQLMRRLVEGNTPVILFSFGSPYHGLQVPGLETFFCAYSCPEVSQEAGADVLLGKLQAEGTLPIDDYEIPHPAWMVY